MICGKQRTDDPRREGYLHLSVRPGYLPALQGRSKGAALTLRFYLCPLIVAQFCRLVYSAWFYTFSMRQERGAPKRKNLPTGGFSGLCISAVSFLQTGRCSLKQPNRPPEGWAGVCESAVCWELFLLQKPCTNQEN